jgi:hypothetical protein
MPRPVKLTEPVPFELRAPPMVRRPDEERLTELFEAVALTAPPVIMAPVFEIMTFPPEFVAELTVRGAAVFTRLKTPLELFEAEKAETVFELVRVAPPTELVVRVEPEIVPALWLMELDAVRLTVPPVTL